jgi:2-oxoglutarate dehydrogenase complex dehydrogenase (E1) component-like enzyme
VLRRQMKRDFIKPLIIATPKNLLRAKYAWTFIEPRLRALFCTEIAYAGREASASPAVGALARHKREQARLVADAFLL